MISLLFCSTNHKVLFLLYVAADSIVAKIKYFIYSNEKY